MSAEGARTGTHGVSAPGPESRLTDRHHETLRLWLRLLTCTLMVEREIRTRLRTSFDTTLPRFDLMSQLERNPEGLRMGELSRRMMVTGGNVTGITDQLVAEGLVERKPIPEDGRAYAVRLTARGKRQFDAMAHAHERWIEAMLGALPSVNRARLHDLLGRLKAGLAHELERGAATPEAQDKPGPRNRMNATSRRRSA